VQSSVQRPRWEHVASALTTLGEPLHARAAGGHNGAVIRRLSPLAVALTLCAAACNDESSGPQDDAGAPVDPLTWSVTEPGPYACGHRTLETTYTPPGGLPPRTIPVHVWYPSDVAEGDHPVYRSLFVDEHAWEDVPLAKSPWKAGLPVLVHSHGHKGFAGNSARLMCHFASHGWLAVAPEHVGNTLGDTPDVRPLALYFERPLDVRAALDLVSAPPAGDPLAGAADLAHVAMSGHSFGTYTAWAVAGATFDAAAIQKQCDAGEVGECAATLLAVFATDLSEKRASIVVPMAGGRDDFFGDKGYDAAGVPVLLMSGSLDVVGADSLFADVSGVDLTWVDVDGGCHQLFGLGNAMLGAAACKDLPDEEGFSIVNPWVLAYTRYHVLADRGDQVSGIVEGSASLSARVHVEHKGP
jgi:predicted dienelactone hydrolase